MNNHPCDIYKIARECGVILRDSFDHSPTSRKSRECFCKYTLKAIGREQGEDHLRLVLSLLTGTPQNSRQLYADVIKAVSFVLVHNPVLMQSKTLVSDFDAIDFAMLRAKSKQLNCGIARTQILRVILALKLTQPAQRDLLDDGLETAA